MKAEKFARKQKRNKRCQLERKIDELARKARFSADDLDAIQDMEERFLQRG